MKAKFFRLIFCMLLILCKLQSFSQQISVANQKLIDSHKEEVIKYQNERNNNKLATTYAKIAQIYRVSGSYEKAIEYFNLSLEINKTVNKGAIPTILTFIANCYENLQQHDKALSYLEESLKLTTDKDFQKSLKKQIANAYFETKNYDKAVAISKELLEIANEKNDTLLQKYCYGILKESYEKLNNDKEAKYYSDLYLLISQKISSDKNREMSIRAANERAAKEVALVENESQRLKLKFAQDSIFKSEQENRENREKINLLNENKRLLEEHTKEQEAKLQNEKKVRNYLILGISALILLLLGITYLLKINRKKSRLLGAQNEMLETQKSTIQMQFIDISQKNKMIQEKHRKLSESITSARRIQTAILPLETSITDHFPESFVFLRARDVVSGDFYWVSQQEEKFFIAAVDCTGHGVPGAFMSVITNTLLNEIVNENKIFIPSEILKNLHEKFLSSLHEKNIRVLEKEDIKISADDGVDITLFCIDKKNQKIIAACSNHYFFKVKENKIETIEGNIGFIGLFLGTKKKKCYFTDTEIPIEKGTTFYMFSDGFQDQQNFEGKKFNQERFKNMILEMQTLNMTEQKNVVEKTFNEWRRNEPQIDDVLLVGLRF